MIKPLKILYIIFVMICYLPLASMRTKITKVNSKTVDQTVPLSALPNELLLEVLRNKLRMIIKSNNCFNPLNNVERFFFKILNIDKRFRDLRNELKTKNVARNLAKEYFSPKIINEKMSVSLEQLNEELKHILECPYNYENEQEAARLIIAGANPNLFISYYNNILQEVELVPILTFISKTGQFLNLIDILIDYGADIEYKNKNGNNALMFAAWSNHDHIVKLLLKRGANINAINNYQYSALLGLFCSIDSTNMLNIFKMGKADFALKDPEGNYNVLMLAIFDNCKKSVEFIVSQNLVDIDEQDSKGFTALMYAAQSGYYNIVEMLIQYKANVNLKNKDGLTAKDLAFKEGYYNIVLLFRS